MKADTKNLKKWQERHDIVIGRQSTSRAEKGKMGRLETLRYQMEKSSMEEQTRRRLYNHNEERDEDWTAYDLRHRGGWVGV